MVDEILYQSCIHPSVAANELNKEQSTRVYESLKNIVRIANECLWDRRTDFPPDWLFHRRWSKGKGPVKSYDGRSIEFVTVGGRTSAVVPSVQLKSTKRIKSEAEQETETEKSGKSQTKKRKVASAPIKVENGGDKNHSIPAKKTSKRR